MSDVLERAKDLRHYLAHKAEWQDESVIVQELIAEVERLRSAFAHELDMRDRHIESLEARIKELEEMIKQLGRLAFMHDVPLEQIIAHFVAWGKSNYDYTSRLEAAFLEEYQRGCAMLSPNAAKEALERIKEGKG